MKKPLILVADDDMDDQFLLETAFNESGDDAMLVFVENGVELINYLTNLREEDEPSYPDLIILDLNMPLKNGKECLRELKQDLVFRNIPVTVYTTTNSNEEIKQCFELGASKYIVKPVRFEELRKVVDGIKKSLLTNESISVLN